MDIDKTKTDEQTRLMARCGVAMLQLACIAIAVVAIVYVGTGDFDTPTWGAVLLWWVTKLGGIAIAYGCCKGYAALKRIAERMEE